MTDSFKVRIIEQPGRNAGEIMLYALSTCVWCRRTKKLLLELGVAFKYLDLDLLSERESGPARVELEKWNPACSFPTLVINGRCIVGFKEDAIREALAE